ncbi:MAG: aminoglycoside phosphotransferase family protein [Nocardioidaceae bacterium]|nr:aminoglycoside phosphotransferase family protein [Nocardioidaceae bacterium]
MTMVDGLVAALEPAGLRLRTVHPREHGRLTLGLTTVDGQVCAAQWHAHAERTAAIATELRERFGSRDVQVLDEGRLVVQHRGADRRLVALRDVLGSPGAVLVSHRPERRAVVRTGPTRTGADRYVKVVRPGRIAEVVPPPGLHATDLRIPQVIATDDDQGTVTMTAVRGRTLYQALADPRIGDRDMAVAGRLLGAALRSLHAGDAASPRPVHDRAAELAAARRTLAAASGHGLLDAGVWESLLAEAGAVLDAQPPALALLHRDLHDKQVILEPGRPVGLVDLDLVALGDPALDLANLAVHLDLRARQHHCSPARARHCLDGVLGGYGPDAGLLGRLPGYARTTRLRLAGVYAFRRPPPGLVGYLLHGGVETVPSS